MPITANRRGGGSYICAAECAKALLSLRDGGTLVIDQQGQILQEYRNYLNYKGQPGAGDAFLRWFFNNRHKPDLCREVSLTPLEHVWRTFAEFPDDPELANFDRADQKFVAAATAAGAEILQAADHKWLAWNASLQRQGVMVRFLCRQELEATAQKKKRSDL